MIFTREMEPVGFPDLMTKEPAGGLHKMENESRDDHRAGAADPENRPLCTLMVGSNRTCVNLELRELGRDLLLLVTGGEAHVGAVGVWPAASEGAPAAVTELPGHREGPLAGECAAALGRATGKAVVAVVGIHQDNATREEIEAIVAHVRQGTGAVVAALAARNGAGG